MWRGIVSACGAFFELCRAEEVKCRVSPDRIVEPVDIAAQEQDLSRSSPSLDDTVTPQSASSSPPAAFSQIQTRINEPNKPAAKEAERKNLSRSPRSLNDAATPQSASSSPPAVSSQVQTRINEGASPAQPAAIGVITPGARIASDGETERKDVSRSPPSLDDTPQSASSSPAAVFQVQR